MVPQETSRTPLIEGRRLLEEAVGASLRLADQAAEAQTTLAAVRSTHRPDDPAVVAAEREQEQRLERLRRARADVAEARRRLASSVGAFLADDPSDDIGRLDAAFPMVLLPVRLETRFHSWAEQHELRVRLYPDSIHVHTHDPVLTVAEREAGLAYWRNGWEDEPRAWTDLLREFPAPRAAWIVRATEPTNLETRPQGQPIFPEFEVRSEAWVRAPEARLLPDRWLVLAFRGDQEVLRGATAAVREHLAVGFDPQSPPGEGVDIVAGELRLDPELAWAVDFAEAEKAGMAARLPLAAEDLQLGFDLVLAVGVKGSLTPDEAARGLRDLLDGHHFAGGLAFVRQGTPTNNMEGGRAGYPPHDPGGERRFALERGEPLELPVTSDGARAMRALGLERTLVAHVDRADSGEQEVSRAMNQALWPVTWGYYLRQMMAPHLSDDAIEQTRRHFVEHVRGRGPLPALRVRAQPYGLLPITSLSRWTPLDGATTLERELPALLRRLAPHWRAGTGRGPAPRAYSGPRR